MRLKESEKIVLGFLVLWLIVFAWKYIGVSLSDFELEM